MTLIYSLILCLVFGAGRCQLPCVKEPTKSPELWASAMMEGQSGTVTCTAEILCNESLKVHWEWTKADGQSLLFHWNGLQCFDGYCADTFALAPIADDHNTDITCVAYYGHTVVRKTLTVTVKFPPTIQNGSQCLVEGNRVVCLCISQGNPLPRIRWCSASLTNFSVTSWSHIQTVHSTITMLAAEYKHIQCIVRNELGRTETEPLLRNYTENYSSDAVNPRPDAAISWVIAGVSLSVNLVLLTTLSICTYKRGKSQQREPCEENAYASLNQADVEPEYSVITPCTRGVNVEAPRVACAIQEI